MFEDFFIERLTSLRNQKNVSAREMSLALGQNGSYINRIENRLAFPSMQVFSIFVNIFKSRRKNFLTRRIPRPEKSLRLQKSLKT